MPLSSFHCVHSGVFNYTTQQNTTIKKIHTSSHANSGICMPTPKKKKEINKGKKKFWAREDMMAPLGRHCCRAKLQDPPPFSSSFRHSHPLFSYIFQLLHMWKKEENGQEMGNFILPGLAFTTFTTFTTPWPVTMAICRCLANPYGLNPLSPPFPRLLCPGHAPTTWRMRTFFIYIQMSAKPWNRHRNEANWKENHFFGLEKSLLIKSHFQIVVKMSNDSILLIRNALSSSN